MIFGRFAQRAVDCFSKSGMSRISGCSCSPLRSMWMSLFAAMRPISSFGCANDVIFTGEYSETLELSKPVTSTSSGTRTPRLVSRSIAP